MRSITLTVFFDDPFWIGLFERLEDGTLTVCRQVFGSLPSDREIYDWLARATPALRFSPPVEQSAPGFHEGEFQFRLVDLGDDARKPGTSAHIHHAAGYFRLAGKEQAVEEMLVLDALGVGDGGQVDLLVVVYKDLGKGIQLVQLGAGEGNVPCGTLGLQPLFVDHRF